MGRTVLGTLVVDLKLGGDVTTCDCATDGSVVPEDRVGFKVGAIVLRGERVGEAVDVHSRVTGCDNVGGSVCALAGDDMAGSESPSGVGQEVPGA